MKGFHIVVCLALVAMLVWMGQVGTASNTGTFGGLSRIGWASLTTIIVVAAIVFVFNDSARANRFFRRLGALVPSPDRLRTLTSSELAELHLDKYRGPAYPHPVIFPDR